MRVVSLGPIALFSSFQLTTSSGKDLEVINHAHIVSSMYKLITSAKDTVDLLLGLVHWYVPLYTPSFPQQGKLSKQILSETYT